MDTGQNLGVIPDFTLHRHTTTISKPNMLATAGSFPWQGPSALSSCEKQGKTLGAQAAGAGSKEPKGRVGTAVGLLLSPRECQPASYVPRPPRVAPQALAVASYTPSQGPEVCAQGSLKEQAAQGLC